MKFNKIYIILFSLFLTTFNVFSQENIKKSENPVLPISIYTVIDTTTNFNSLFSINNRLNFKDYAFVYLDEKKLRDGYFTIPIENITKTPSMFIYETYMDTYHKRNLEKAFFKVSDLYKPFIPPK
jgi:hypothetical protein